MTVLGALCAGVAVTSVVLATRSPTAVALTLARVRPLSSAQRRLGTFAMMGSDALTASGIGCTLEQLAAAKIGLGLAAGCVAALASTILPLGPLAIATAGYLGFVGPSLLVEARARRRRLEAEGALGMLVEWTHALAMSGRPVENALVALARRGVGEPIVDGVLRRSERLYTLGAPLYPALVSEARLAGLATLARIGERLERARELGHGSLKVLEEMRDELRASARERLLAAASHVEGKLTLILVLCYLPALVLLVVIPLFLTLLAGLFG